MFRVERLRSIESRPLARIRTYLPLPTCAPVAGVDLTDASLHETLTTHLNLTPTSRPRQVRVVSAGPELATELDVAFGSPLLLLEGQTADQHGQPLEVFATWHRAGDVAFDLQAGRDLSPTSAPPADLARAASQARLLAEQLERLAST